MHQHLKRPLGLDRLANTARLTKPFRSPLKSSSAHAPAADQPEAGLRLHTADTLAPSASVSDDNTVDADVDADALHKRYLDLSRQLTQLRQSLDTAQQAVNILQNDRETSVQSLIDRWKAVIRDAADDLYDDAKVRVERDGGLTRSRRRSFVDFANEDPVLTAEQQELLRVQQAEDRAQAIKYGLIESIEPADDDHEDKVSSLRGIVSPLIHLSPSRWRQCCARWMSTSILWDTTHENNDG